MKERPILFSGPMVRALLDGSKTQTRRLVKLPKAPMHLGEWEPITLGGGKTFRFVSGGERVPVPAEVAIWHTRTGQTICCPYGVPGDRLWVRESWKTPVQWDHLSGAKITAQCLKDGYSKPRCPVKYLADGWLEHNAIWRSNPDFVPGRHRHSRFMPKWASRITLEIVSVRVERLQDISEAAAMAEGAIAPTEPFRDANGLIPYPVSHTHTFGFQRLWDSIHGKVATARHNLKALQGLKNVSSNSWAANPWVWVVEFKKVTA